MQERSEINLIAESKRGNKEAFGELVLRYGKQVYNLSYRLLRNRADAEDLSQDAFLQAFLSIKRFREETNFYNWLYRIVVNIWKNRVKYESRRHFSRHFSLDEVAQTEGGQMRRELPDPAPLPDQSLAKSKMYQMIQESISTLVPEQRIVFILRDIEGRSYEDIAKALRCRLGTVKSRLSRAREELRKRLSPYLRGEEHEM